jgi:hypothetical protein
MNNHHYESAFASTQQVATVGKLQLPTGTIVACDPYFCADALPFVRSVEPGEYEVQLSLAHSAEWGTRVALARIIFEPGVEAVRFEEALKEGAHTSHYFVDSGVGSFMDVLAREALIITFADFYRLHPSGNYYTDVLAAEFKRNALNPQEPGDLGRWVLHQLPNSPLNVAIFASGLGDSVYASWWGLTKQGDVVSLVTDFRLI